MTEKIIKIPNTSDPITVEPTPERVVITVAGRVVADSTNALSLREASYPVVQYIPRSDVDMALLMPSDHATYCPYKGDCSYFSIAPAGARGVNAVWTYEDPYAAVVAIKNHLAFYPDRVDGIELRAK